MVTVVYAERKSAILTPSSLACLAAIPTINLTAGCAHGCVYCYTRGYRTYPGSGRVVLYSNTLEKLKNELARKRSIPKAVYFSPSSDAFQPLAEVLAMSYDVMKFLFESGVGVAFLTKGAIPERHMSLFRQHAALVRAQVGVTTLDGEISRQLEPHAAPPKARLKQASELVRAGVPTEARLDPIVPAMTDCPGALPALLCEIRAAGIRKIAVSALFLRTSLLRRSGGGLMHSLHDRFYKNAEVLDIDAEQSKVLALPRGQREQLYSRLRALAGEFGLTVQTCGCKNPDMAAGGCNIAGEWSDGMLPGIS